MWIFTTIGFFSVVAHAEDADTIVIRARVRDDLDALRRHHLPDIEIAEGDGWYRSLVSRYEWEHLAQQLAQAVDYADFEPDKQRLQSAARGKSSRSPRDDPEHHLG